MEHVEVLPLVLMNPLHLDVEESVRIYRNSGPFLV